MKHKKKSKAIDKSRRNHPVQDEASKEIDSSKGASGDVIKTPRKAEQNIKKSKSAQKATNADALTPNAKGMDQNAVLTQRNGHNNGSDIVHNRQATDQGLGITSVMLVKNDGSDRRQGTSLQKQVGNNKGSGQPAHIESLQKLEKALLASSEEILPIHITAAMSDVNKVRHFFGVDPLNGKSRCDPNIRCLSDGSTALLLAIRSKQTEAARILLENGADVTLTDNTGDNALMAAIKSGDANVINAIWPYRGQLDVNHVNNAGWSALHLATDRKWECCINFLLQNRANPNRQSTDGLTPLMLAASSGDTKSADNLIKSGADILMEDFEGYTCICKAFDSGKKDMVYHLLQKLPTDRKDVFVRSRLDVMMRQGCREEEKRQLENSYLPVLHLCTEDPVFRSSFYNSRALQKITKILEKHSQNFEISLLASHLIFCIMFRFSREFELKFVKQFIRCRGPEIVMYITKLYTEQWKIPEREMVTIFLPMIGLSELTEGRVWLKKNWVSVSEYLNFFDKNSLKYCLSGYSDSHWCPACEYVDDIAVVWQRFHDVMNDIQTEERVKHMTELLEEEEREKERQLKKKEKKKHKKQDKQNNSEDNMEVAVCEETNQHLPLFESSEMSITTKNANSNAGPEDSKPNRRQKKIVDVAKTFFQTSPTEVIASNKYANVDPCQEATGFPELIQADLHPKTEQWTTIQTKKQIQKDKEKKQGKKQNESMQPDSQGKAKKTPRKSPKKKLKGDQNLPGQTYSAVPVSGSTRWADIAKGMVKPNTRVGPKVPTSNNKAKVLQRQERVNFGEIDFPSLHGQPEEFTFPEKKNYIKPAKFTFHFDEPIVASKPSDQQNDTKALQNDDVHFDKEENNWDYKFSADAETEANYVPDNFEIPAPDHGHAIYNQTATVPANDHYEDVWGPNDANTDQMVGTWVEAEMSSVMEDSSCYNGDIYRNSDIQKYEHTNLATEIQENEYTEEDWSDEIKHIDNACDSIQTPSYHNYMIKGDSVNNTAGNDTAVLYDHSNISSPHGQQETGVQDKTSIGSIGNTDYVGPENCQVHIKSIIQHQISAFPYFEENVVRNRSDDPFFDPSVPLPEELRFGDDTTSNPVDALFEDAEEIPSWYTDSDTPNYEDTWNDMQESSSTFVKDVPPSDYEEDFSSIDPAIIGYKNMTSNQPCHKKTTPDKQVFKKRTMVHGRSQFDEVCPDQDSFNHYADEHEHEYPSGTETRSEVYNQEYDTVEKQTAVIKPLQSKSKKAVPAVNSAFGQTLLENACRLERTQHDDSVAYPDEIDGEPFPEADSDAAKDFREADNRGSGDSPFHFPSFHADTKLSAHMNKRDVSMFHLMQQVQLEQLARYYKQHKQNIVNETASGYHDNFVYYASCAGMSKQEMEDCLSGKVEGLKIKEPALDSNTKPNKTFKEITKPMTQTFQKDTDKRTSAVNNTRHQSMLQNGAQQSQMTAQTLNRQVPHMPVPNMFPIGQYLPPAMHPANIQAIQATQAAMAASVMNQIKEVYKSMMKAKMKSVRWKEELWQLRNLPTERQMVVGKIVVPKEDHDRIYIARPSSGPVTLGFLTDGTEVAVKIIDWRERDFTLQELQHLVNLDVSKYFMNKYKAFCSQDGYYYVAMALYEYSLPEYLGKMRRDDGVDEGIASSKLVWQFMRGLASLHQHCLMVHGELRPENVVIDTDGYVRIAGYGLGKNTNRDTPFVEYSEDEMCWLAPEALVHKQKVSFKSDIFVAGMLTYYILSGGNNPFGSEPTEIIENIAEQNFETDYITEEAGHLLSLMLSVNKSERPCISDALRHPYFWADEKRLRFILIAGSDVLRDLKAGIPMDGSVRDSMIGIIGTTPCHIRIINWISDIESVIMREMRVFRQYKNNVVELVLFVYNCCLHFDKMSDNAREIIDEPCKYFLNKFPTLFMTAYRAIKNSSRTERTCYKPFF